MSPRLFRILHSIIGHCATCSRVLRIFFGNVQVADRDDEMDRICPEVRGIIDILVQGPDIGADLGRESGIRDEPDCFTLSFRCSSRTGFDDIDTNVRRVLVAISSFWSGFNETPGVCSPSRNVVSKKRRLLTNKTLTHGNHHG